MKTIDLDQSIVVSLILEQMMFEYVLLVEGVFNEYPDVHKDVQDVMLRTIGANGAALTHLNKVINEISDKVEKDFSVYEQGENIGTPLTISFTQFSRLERDENSPDGRKQQHWEIEEDDEN